VYCRLAKFESGIDESCEGFKNGIEKVKSKNSKVKMICFEF